jgi:hypothetical protein
MKGQLPARHAIRTIRTFWCKRHVYDGRGRYLVSTPDNPTTCRQCLAAMKRAGHQPGSL